MKHHKNSNQQGPVRTLGRRQFLVGAGGFALALPFLPSLLSKESQAADRPVPPRFVAMGTNHGGIWESNMYPDASLLMGAGMYAGHEIRRGTLGYGVNANRGRISHVLSGPSDKLTRQLADKMNIIRGIDIPFYIAHHTGGHLGNFARNDGNGGDGEAVQAFPFPTIDQVMAWSDEFYPNLDGVLERSMLLGSGRFSYNYANPSQKMGDIQALDTTHSSLDVFNRIFVPRDNGQNNRTPVADRVLENYRRLRQSNKRMSAGDKRRLDEHIQRIDELQRKLNTKVACDDVARPTKNSQDVRHTQGYHYQPVSMREYWQLHNDVVAAAFACGTSRIASMYCGDTFSMFQGDWHQDIAHQALLTNNNAQQTIADAHQRFFEDVFLDLIRKLDDIEDAPGQTVLDNSLVMWTQESGLVTHNSYGIPIITAGSACGQLNTGRYLDYRNMTKRKTYGDNAEVVDHPGLIYNQWLGNVLMAMGLTPANYERGNRGGYGHFFIGQHGWYQQPDFYPNSVSGVMGEKLPGLWV